MPCMKDDDTAETSTMEYISDPAKRMVIIKACVGELPERIAMFNKLLQELDKWRSNGFEGSLESLYKRLVQKVRPRAFHNLTARSVLRLQHGHKTAQWMASYHRWKLLYYQFVEGLQNKGNPRTRGPR